MVKHVSTNELAKLRKQGLSYRQIADRFGMTRQNVHKRLNYVGNAEFNAKRRKIRV